MKVRPGTIIENHSNDDGILATDGWHENTDVKKIEILSGKRQR
jgi:hypothetical protein